MRQAALLRGILALSGNKHEGLVHVSWPSLPILACLRFVPWTQEAMRERENCLTWFWPLSACLLVLQPPRLPYRLHVLRLKVPADHQGPILWRRCRSERKPLQRCFQRGGGPRICQPIRGCPPIKFCVWIGSHSGPHSGPHSPQTRGRLTLPC